MDDLAHARALCDALGGLFCLTYLKGVDAAGALRRLGGCPNTVRERTAAEVTERRQSSDAGFPELGVALELGAWTVVVEPGGAVGADHAVLEAASRGTAAVSVLRHDSAAAHFGYAVDGTTISGFDPGYPAQETIWGADPGMLRHLMDALGLRPPSDEYQQGRQDAEARAIVLAQRITGVRLPDRPLAGEHLSAELEPWFVTPAAGADLLRASRRSPYAGDLVTAAEAADPRVQRAVAVAEVRRQATVLGIVDTPGLADALEATGPVPVESALGRQVRGWLADVRRAARATGSPAGFGLAWFLAALRGVRQPDPRVAVLAALRPYTSGLPGLADEQARASVLAALHGQAR